MGWCIADAALSTCGGNTIAVISIDCHLNVHQQVSLLHSKVSWHSMLTLKYVSLLQDEVVTAGGEYTCYQLLFNLEMKPRKEKPRELPFNSRRL